MKKAWYKQFWPWFLIAIPVSSFIMTGVLIRVATTTENALVVDDYYKEGKAINVNLDKLSAAKRNNITTELVIDEGAVALKFHSGIPQDGVALKMSFYHTTLQERDTSILLSRDANGVYRGLVEAPLAGKWQISLEPIDARWKIQNTLVLPISGPVAFNP